MSTKMITVAQARSDFSNLLAQVELLRCRFVIARRGRPKAVLVSVDDLARLEALDQAAASTPTAERDRAVQALQQAGLLRPVSPELVSRYVHLSPQEREAVRQELASRRFEPPLSQQIIEDRGER
jgi:prevent-host-death family protein